MPVVVDVQGLPETKRLLAELDERQLQNRMRRALRAGAKVMRQELRRQAASRSDLPRSFRKTRTRSHRNPLGVSVSPKSPLSNIFEPGAPRHSGGRAGQLPSNASGEAARGGEPLFGAWGPVSHPGMAARPLIAPVFAAAERPAEKAVGDTLFEGIR